MKKEIIVQLKRSAGKYALWGVDWLAQSVLLYIAGEHVWIGFDRLKSESLKTVKSARFQPAEPDELTDRQVAEEFFRRLGIDLDKFGGKATDILIDSCDTRLEGTKLAFQSYDHYLEINFKFEDDNQFRELNMKSN